MADKNKKVSDRKQISIYLPKQKHADFKEACDKNGFTMNAVMSHFITGYIKRGVK